MTFNLNHKTLSSIIDEKDIFKPTTLLNTPVKPDDADSPNHLESIKPNTVYLKSLQNTFLRLPFDGVDSPLHTLLNNVLAHDKSAPNTKDIILTTHKLFVSWANLHTKDAELSTHILYQSQTLLCRPELPCLRHMINLIDNATYYLDCFSALSKQPEQKVSEISVFQEMLSGLGILHLDSSSSRQFPVIDQLINSMVKVLMIEVPCPTDYSQSRIELICNGTFEDYQTLSRTLGDFAETAGRWPIKFEPRKYQELAWIKEAVELTYPVPLDIVNNPRYSENSHNIQTLFQNLYNVFTSFTFFKFTLDDLADEVRDHIAVDAYSQIFPSCYENDTLDSYNLRYRSYLTDAGELVQLTTPENVARFLHDYLEKNDESLKRNEELRGALVNYLQFSFELFHKTFRQFEQIVQRAERIAATAGIGSPKDDLTTSFEELMNEVLYTFFDVFLNYFSRVRANSDPSAPYLETAALKSHNNMNMVPFHMMITWVNLTLAGVKKDSILSVFKKGEYVQMIEAEQKMGRYGNCVATAAPRKGQPSRELVKGDISGMFEVIFELKKKTEHRTLRNALNRQLGIIGREPTDKGATSDQLSPRFKGIKELIKIFIEYDSEYILLKLFTEELAKIKRYSETTKAFAIDSGINPNLLFSGLAELEPNVPINSAFFNSYFELFYLQLIMQSNIE